MTQNPTSYSEMGFCLIHRHNLLRFILLNVNGTGYEVALDYLFKIFAVTSEIIN
jgi:hypothetical protein